MGPTLRLVGLLLIASLHATNGDFKNIVNRLYAKATDNKPLLQLLGSHALRSGQSDSQVLGSGNAYDENDDQGRNDNENRNDDQDQRQNYRNQNRYRNQRISSRNHHPRVSNDLLVYINGGKSRQNGYSQLGNIIAAGLSKNRKNRVRYSHHHRDHHNNNNDQYDSQEVNTQDRHRGRNRYLDNSGEQNQYDSQEVDGYQNRQSRINRLENNYNRNRQSRHRQNRNKYRNQQNSDRSQKHRNRHQNRGGYWTGNKEDQDDYHRQNRYDQHDRNYQSDRSYQRLQNGYDQHLRDKYKQDRHDQRNHERYDQDYSEKYNRFVSKGIGRQAALSRSPVVKSLLRISNDINCGAQEECKDECGNTIPCEEQCEEKFECEEEKKELDECEQDECNSNEDDNISTRGVTLEPEQDECKRCKK